MWDIAFLRSPIPKAFPGPTVCDGPHTTGRFAGAMTGAIVRLTYGSLVD
jgi:hypothetical protein